MTFFEQRYYVVQDPSTGKYLSEGGWEIHSDPRWAGTWNSIAAAKAAITKYKIRLRRNASFHKNPLPREASIVFNIVEGVVRFDGIPVETYAGK